jgi:hypothetical protein
MMLLPESDPLPSPPAARVPAGDAAGRLLAALLAVADDREPELVETGSRT